MKKNGNNNILMNKNFALLFWGKLISQLGDSIFTFALIWHIMNLTGAAIQSGFILALAAIPSIILGPIGGVIADKYNRVKIIVSMDIIRGIIMTGLLILQLSNKLDLIHIYTSVILVSVFGALFTPACTAIIPNIVVEEKLMAANSLDSILVNVSQIFGALLGAIIYQILGLEGVLIINAISFIGSGMFEMFIKLQYHNQSYDKFSIENSMYEVKMGFKYLYSNKPLFVLFIFLIFWNFWIFPIMQVYLPYIFNNILNASALQLSLVQISFGIGVILASITINKKITFYNKQITTSYLMVSIILFCNTLTLSPCMKNVSLNIIVGIYFVVSLLCGVFIGRGYIPVGVVYQKDVPDEIRGRINSILFTFEKLSVPFGFCFAGALAGKIDMYILNAFSTFILIIACVLLKKSEAMKRL